MKLQNQKKLNSILLVLFLSMLLCFDTACALVRQPKFGPYATPITQKTGFLRQTPAYDYWKFSQFYLPQQTSSACGLASVAMALNFLLGVPKYFDETLITQNALLETVFTGPDGKKVAENGDGLMFDDLVRLVKKGLKHYKLKNYTVEVIRASDTPSSLAEIKQVLEDNERRSNDLILAYYNQGVLTSDWDGPHISPIGAYDSVNQKVLMMDVDRDFYVPYWSPVRKLQEALIRPAPADQGALEGEVGGLVRIMPEI